MDRRPRITVVARRRDVLLGAAASASLTALIGAARAQEKPADNGVEAALKKIIGEGKSTDGRITIDVPEIAENGNTVPYTISVESPMTQANHVKALHVLASGNPQPGVASFFLSPQCGKAQVTSRMRLGRTQDIVIAAEHADGRVVVARRLVKVTIGGCGG